jgi:hypothetical protein
MKRGVRLLLACTALAAVGCTDRGIVGYNCVDAGCNWVPPATVVHDANGAHDAHDANPLACDTKADAACGTPAAAEPPTPSHDDPAPCIGDAGCDDDHTDSTCDDDAGCDNDSDAAKCDGDCED